MEQHDYYDNIFTDIRYNGDFLSADCSKLNVVILPWFSSFFQKPTIILPIFDSDFNTSLAISVSYEACQCHCALIFIGNFGCG